MQPVYFNNSLQQQHALEQAATALIYTHFFAALPLICLTLCLKLSTWCCYGLKGLTIADLHNLIQYSACASH